MPAAASREIVVWDPLLRLFHWSLVSCFAITLLVDGDTPLHNGAGLTAAGLVGFRMVWGFIGPRHARFSDFVPRPHVLLRYLGDLLRLRESRTLGHNPAGAVMILGLLGITLVLAITGWLMTTDTFYGVRWIQDLHEGASDLAIAMIVAHVAGVTFSSVRHRENLVRAMVTGRKRA